MVLPLSLRPSSSSKANPPIPKKLYLHNFLLLLVWGTIELMQPGDTFHPGNSNGGDPSKNDEGVTNEPQNSESVAPQENAAWYHPETPALGQSPTSAMSLSGGDGGVSADQGQSGDIAWTASEFVAHEKPFMWYIAFMFIALLIAGATFLITHEIITVVAVVGALGAFGAMATRRPRVLDYGLNDTGVRIGPKLYPYVSFRSFSLYDDGALHAVDLLPMERFKPPVTVYFPPEQEQQVLSKLGDNLPYENRNPDLVDRLMHRLHF